MQLEYFHNTIYKIAVDTYYIYCLFISVSCSYSPQTNLGNKNDLESIGEPIETAIISLMSACPTILSKQVYFPVDPRR